MASSEDLLDPPACDERASDEQASRDALLEAVLRDVPFDGWSRAALLSGGQAAGLDEAAVLSLFPAGPRDAVAWFSHWADRLTLERLAEQDLAALKVRQRIALGVMTRLEVLTPHREAVRRALSFLALPQHAPLGLKLLYDTVDALWYAAGDTATDFNFYSKRGLLAGVYAATTLYWLDERSPEGGATRAFLERRLAEVLALPRLGARLRAVAGWLPDPFRLVRVMRRS